MLNRIPASNGNFRPSSRVRSTSSWHIARGSRAGDLAGH